MRGFWIGVAAGCAFLAVELASRLIADVPTISELIQDRLVLFLPGPVFAFVLDRLLYLGKPSLFAGLALLQLVLAGLGGLIFQRWRQPIALAVVPWLLTGLILLPAAGQGIFAGSLSVAFDELIGFAAYATALVLYTTRLGRGWRLVPANRIEVGTSSASTPPDLDRRLVVGGGLTFVASLFLGQRIVGTLPALPPEPGAPAPGPATSSGSVSLPTLTPADQFYVVSKNLVDPTVDAGSWRLSISGQVSQPLAFSYADILALPSTEIDRTLECISNEVGGNLISTGRWTGVRLADLLKRAGVASTASLIHFTSVDGYTENMALAKALDPGTLLVYKLDGQPLPQKHGFPLRVLGAGTYGMKNPKWLISIEVAESAPAGFWEGQGWNPDAIVQTMSRIDDPKDGAVLHLGPIVVQGIAFAGARGVQRVEVSPDGGTSWAAAELSQPLGPNTWSLWRYTWQPTKAGSYTLVTRATDGAGRTQVSTMTDTFPAGATGYHSISLRVIA